MKIRQQTKKATAKTLTSKETKSVVEDMKEISPTKPNVTTYSSHPYIYMYVTDQHLDLKLNIF